MKNLNRDDFVEMDKTDSLNGFRDDFHLRDGLVYLDGNSLGALPKEAIRRMSDVVKNEWGEGLITSWLGADWVNAPQRIGDKLATIIGAASGEVIVADSTSVNIFKALTAALSLNGGRKVILSETTNFPTDVYMMQGLEALCKGEVTVKTVAPEQVVDHLNDDVAVLLLTQVHYKTGKIRNMKEITQTAHDKGVLVIWDLSHSAGSINVDLNDSEADFAVGCGYKFLNGGPGAPAFLFVARRHQSKAMVVLSGWFGHKTPFSFDENYEPSEGVRRFLCGTPPVLGLTALECGIDLFCRADMREVRKKAVRLGDLFIALMEQKCGAFGFELISPSDGNERGSQISYQHEKGYEIMQALKEREVIGDFRAPDVLRFGLTPLYLRYQDIYDAVEIIRQVMDLQAWNRPEYKVRAAVT